MPSGGLILDSGESILRVNIVMLAPWVDPSGFVLITVLVVQGAVPFVEVRVVAVEISTSLQEVSLPPRNIVDIDIDRSLVASHGVTQVVRHPEVVETVDSEPSPLLRPEVNLK